VGAFRVNPDSAADGTLTIESPDTGKASLAQFLVDISSETYDQIDAGYDPDTAQGRENSIRGLLRALQAVVDAAERAAEDAAAGDTDSADQQLETVAMRLENVSSNIDDASDTLSDPLTAAARNRLDQAQLRNEQAREADRL